MINPVELRIGNFIYRQNGFHDKISAYDFEHANFEALNPIPLTPEILGKSGFDSGVGGFFIKDSDGDWLLFNGLVNGVLEPDMYYTGANISEKAKPKYLHQLQNLYFALTGEELKIEL